MRPTGSAPHDVKRAVMLPIDSGIPLPEDMMLPRGVIRNTLLALEPGQSFVVAERSVSTVYARAKDLRVKVRVKVMPDGKTARVWRAE